MDKDLRITEAQKEHFEAPKAEIIVFSTEDVITASGFYGYIDNDGF